MFRTSLRGVAAFGLALVLATASLSPGLAEAGNRRYKSHPKKGKGNQRVVERHVYHETSNHYYDNHDYHGHSHGSSVGAFLGGVAVGAIIGTHANSYCAPPPPPPPPPRRVWVYDCGPCGYHNRSYDGWVSHLTVVHGVPRCDIAVSYPQNYCGHWEGW
ncbi:MAG TPA: hypothetical protein VF720_08680 [Candidatus Eisenbacteria bacterium]